MLTVIYANVIMLSVIMLSVIMLSVVVPHYPHTAQELYIVESCIMFYVHFQEIIIVSQISNIFRTFKLPFRPYFSAPLSATFPWSSSALESFSSTSFLFWEKSTKSKIEWVKKKFLWTDFIKFWLSQTHFHARAGRITPGNTKGGRISVPLTSCLTHF